MDDDVIEDLADALASEIAYLDTHGFSRFIPAILDAIVAVATVINNHEETYDLRYFYKRAGYPEPYPTHEMR
jgi:hypothetical protein